MAKNIGTDPDLAAEPGHWSAEKTLRFLKQNVSHHNAPYCDEQSTELVVFFYQWPQLLVMEEFCAGKAMYFYAGILTSLLLIVPYRHLDNISTVFTFQNIFQVRGRKRHSSLCGTNAKHAKSHIYELFYSCSQCTKSFPQSDLLQKYERAHVDKKSYSCSMCTMTFPHSSNLQIHVRVHTGEKQFECSMCPKSFSVLGNLHTHVRSHTGEKSYSFSLCTKSFARSTQLRRHVRVHTG